MTKYRAMVEFLEITAVEQGEVAAREALRHAKHSGKSGKHHDIFDNKEFTETIRMLDLRIESYQKRRGTTLAL